MRGGLVTRCVELRRALRDFVFPLIVIVRRGGDVPAPKVETPEGSRAIVIFWDAVGLSTSCRVIIPSFAFNLLLVVMARFLAFCQDLPGTQEGGAEQAPSWGIHQEYGSYYVKLLFTIFFWDPFLMQRVGLSWESPWNQMFNEGRELFSAVEKEMGHGARLVV